MIFLRLVLAVSEELTLLFVRDFLNHDGVGCLNVASLFVVIFF